MRLSSFWGWENDPKLKRKQFVVSLNLNRRHLTSSQKAAIALDVLPMLEREAKERQRAAGRFDGRNPDGSPKLQVTTELKEPEKNHNEAAQQAAAIVGTSATRVYEMKQIARVMPEKVEAIKRGGFTGVIGGQETNRRKKDSPRPAQV